MLRFNVAAIFFIIVLASCNSNRMGYVAEVNGKKITTDEFTERYNKYRSQTSERDNIVLRKKILNNMVNEILIFDDIKKDGFDRDSVFEDKYRDIRDQALLDGYAKLLTVDSMTVSEGELEKEFRAYNTKASARFVYAKTEVEARKLKEQLQRGTTFASLARQVFADPTLSKNGGYLGFFGYDDTEPAMQEAAFSLPVGTLSDPVKLRMGYAIIKVEKRFEMPLASEIDYAKAKPKLEETIRKRKTLQFLEDEGNRIMQSLNMTFDEGSLKQVADDWGYIAHQDIAPPLKEDRYKEIKSIFGLPFAHFNATAWTVGDFVQAAEKTPPKYRRRVRTVDDLKEIAEGLAMRSVLLQKAKDAGLEHKDKVELQVKLARDNYLLHRWANIAEDSVTASGLDEKSTRDYFEKNKNQFTDAPLVDVTEILVRTESEAKQLMKQIQDGADFGMLARTHSIRISAAQRDGELGYVPQSALGIVGERAIRAKVGQIVGPVPLNPNFVILKILGKKPSRQRRFEESKETVVQTLLPGLKQQAFWSAVEKLRVRAVIELNIEALGNVVVASN